MICRDAVRDLDVSSMFDEVGVFEKSFEILCATADDLVLVEDWKGFVVDGFAGGKYARIKLCVCLLQINSVLGLMHLHSTCGVTAARLDDQACTEDMAVGRQAGFR